MKIGVYPFFGSLITNLKSDFRKKYAFDHFSNKISRNLEKQEKVNILFEKWSKANFFWKSDFRFVISDPKNG